MKSCNNYMFFTFIFYLSLKYLDPNAVLRVWEGDAGRSIRGGDKDSTGIVLFLCCEENYSGSVMFQAKILTISFGIELTIEFECPVITLEIDFLLAVFELEKKDRSMCLVGVL